MRTLHSGMFVAVGILGGMFGTYDADMRLDPLEGWPQLNETFTVEVLVEANTPVNVFQGDLAFGTEFLSVESIDYNNSVADLWTSEPWYSNGDGTINFAGGTTQPGGFTGSDTIVSVTFKTEKVGNARVNFEEVRILRHDGLGSDAAIPESVDALFTVQDDAAVIAEKSSNKAKFYVMPNTTPTDLNGDNKQSLADLSMFMGDLAGGNPRSDFDANGKVNLSDLSILLQAE